MAKTAAMLLGWLLFIAFTSYRFHVASLLGGKYDDDASSSSNSTSTNAITTNAKNKKIKIFYNLTSTKIVDEQFAHLNPKLHHVNVSISSIGHQLQNISHHTVQHHENGNEDLGMHELWEYCKLPQNNNHDTLAVYLHSKGSFHPRNVNDKMRRALTFGALSEECANLPDTCNVCSSRFSPLPFPHTPGNMWLARCDCIAKLRDPFLLKQGGVPNIKQGWCSGLGRYYFEHWSHSHPHAAPCDLYAGGEWTWDYFVYRTFPLKRSWKRHHDLTFECRGPPKKYYEYRMWYYDMLFGIKSLDESWWYHEELLQQKFLNMTDPEEWYGLKCVDHGK
ncbi:hypothetical protein ACHAXR_004363 [Thalassiosira sp. AJA248-18]